MQYQSYAIPHIKIPSTVTADKNFMQYEELCIIGSMQYRGVDYSCMASGVSQNPEAGET